MAGTRVLTIMLICMLSSDVFSQARSVDLDVDYVFWWTSGTRTPPLVTISPTGTAQNQAGVLGSSTTSVVFGDEKYFDSSRNGGRFRLTRWLDCQQTAGLEFTYFGGGSAGDGDFRMDSSGNPILARPFFNSLTGLEDSQLIAFPGLVSGNIEINSHNEFHSSSVLAKLNSCRNCQSRIDWLLGYRYFRYREAMGFNEQVESTSLVGLIEQGTTLTVSDSFSTSSSFHGCELGLAWNQSVLDWLSWQGSTRLALGGVNRRLQIRGNTLVNVPSTGTSSHEGGFLALPSNIGDYDDTKFAFLPELGTKLRVLMTSRLEFSIGYTALYLTNASRIGSALDRNIDASQLTSLASQGVASSGAPQASIRDGGLFAQGLSLGVILSH